MCAVCRHFPAAVPLSLYGASHPLCFSSSCSSCSSAAATAAALGLSLPLSSKPRTPRPRLSPPRPRPHLDRTPAKADPASTGATAWPSLQSAGPRTPGSTPVHAARASQDATVRYEHVYFYLYSHWIIIQISLFNCLDCKTLDSYFRKF